MMRLPAAGCLDVRVSGGSRPVRHLKVSHATRCHEWLEYDRDDPDEILGLTQAALAAGYTDMDELRRVSYERIGDERLMCVSGTIECVMEQDSCWDEGHPLGGPEDDRGPPDDRGKPDEE